MLQFNVIFVETGVSRILLTLLTYFTSSVFKQTSSPIAAQCRYLMLRVIMIVKVLKGVKINHQKGLIGVRSPVKTISGAMRGRPTGDFLASL